MNLLEDDLSTLYDLEGTHIEDAENELSQFGTVRFVDEKISDGLDDGDYLMMRSFDVNDIYVRLFYAQSDGLISCVEIC